ncbi:TBC1 domain family member 5 homolog A-like [Salvia hispanica]|uniref:TBC1 domain family member 5 homolog A-like n=1 Tax=Salvia hispanica TaxID=49212 RepID=UPI002009CC91|nr:TBC1 domain family member 5 homolog A-like [Salvia hispanica]
MSQVSIDTEIVETESCSGGSRPFRNFRGVRWRIDLGILPSYPSASVDDLRRITANSRRRYAALRRQLLVDPHIPKDGSSSPDRVMDNPLSQNPDSMWGRFFKNAELERMLDQDLTRLYPERDSYFQTSVCQGILRRILLLWCLRNPEYGYRQGMHEILAPLLYVLHVDVENLSEVKRTYADHFVDKFDGFSFHENDLTYKFDFKKFSDSEGDNNGFENTSAKASSLCELDPEIQTTVLLNDAYGAEGELGIVLSEKFMEHDAYSMFDSLMSGSGGPIAMAKFYSHPSGKPHTGPPPVIEASSAFYHLLYNVDSSLHAHLVELGVEPQYFALRWLRVLFGREFSLEELLVIWDEIFAHENTVSSPAVACDAESNVALLESPRGAFICAFAVSMILNLRSSLLATENATICLQRLLNFPDDTKLAKLLAKAKSLHATARDANKLNPVPIQSELYDRRKSNVTRGHSLSLDSSSPNTPLTVVPDSYWEEKWRVLHKKEENKLSAGGDQVPNRRKGWSERVRLRLSRTESDPSPSKKNERTKIPKPFVRRSLLDDLARQLGADEDTKEDTVSDADVGIGGSVDVNREDAIDKNYESSSSSAGSEDNSSNFSEPSGPIHRSSDNENEVERSSVASDSSMDENDARICVNGPECSPLPVSSHQDGAPFDENETQTCVDNPECSHVSVSSHHDDGSSNSAGNDEAVGKLATGIKEIKHLSGKFQWLWKFGRNVNEGTSVRTVPEDAKACDNGSDQNNFVDISTADGCNRASETSKGETVDQNLRVSWKNIGQSMIENIQVLESVFQQDRGGQVGGSSENLSKNGLVGKGQVTATAALKELRKISNLLSEM